MSRQTKHRSQLKSSKEINLMIQGTLSQPGGHELQQVLKPDSCLVAWSLGEHTSHLYTLHLHM